MIHLTKDRQLYGTALCDNYSDPDNPACIPLRWWNGNRDGMCAECLKKHDGKTLTSATPSTIIQPAAG
jgi:hypothetical protein